jgi:hypothetical protein
MSAAEHRQAAAEEDREADFHEGVLDDEIGEHRAALQPTEPIEALRSECMTHVADVSEVLDGMRAAMGDASCMD